MSIRESIEALVRKRRYRGRWLYLLWLASYSVLAFVATAYAAVLGQDFMGAFLFFLGPALLGYVQFRSPTVLGWALLFLPTALFSVVAFGLFPVALADAVEAHEFGPALTGALLLVVLAVILFGFIRYRPFCRTRDDEPAGAQASFPFPCPPFP